MSEQQYLSVVQNMRLPVRCFPCSSPWQSNSVRIRTKALRSLHVSQIP